MAAPEVKLQADRQITVKAPNGRVTVHPLRKDPITLGRSPVNQLHFPDDPGLSRQHLVLEERGDTWYVRDHGSRNGTYVNKRRVVNEQALKAGDIITAGDISITFNEREMVSFVETDTAPSHTTTHTTDLASALFEGTRFAARDQRAISALIRAGRELSGHQTLGELFDLILDLSMTAAGADRGALLTVEEGAFIPQATRGGSFAISTTVRDRVVRDRASVLVVDTHADAALRGQESIIAQSVRSVIAVPLQTRETVIGLIYLDALNLLHSFSRDDLNLLTVMANIAAIRIEQARLIEVEQVGRMHARELEQAAEIQRQLLPAEPPSIPGFDLAGRNIACRTVGGDYFDYFECPDGRVAVLVGDVAGKGMPAALLMSSLQARLQVLAESALEPADLITRLNVGLKPKCPANRFVTFFYALLEPASGDLLYSNAGHNPPLLIRADGNVEHLDAGGPPVALLNGCKYEQARTVLNPGDSLILFSDGLTEACSPESEDEFGEQRLAEYIEANRELTAAELAEGLIECVRDWTGGNPFADDVTVVIARRASA